MATVDDHAHIAVDESRPSTARLYDYYLGGKDNYESDRVAAEQLVAVVPELPDTARVNRAFHRRAAAGMAARGVSQFIDIGCGLPTMDNTHSVVRGIDPGACGLSRPRCCRGRACSRAARR